jgi:hypothetical protein
MALVSLPGAYGLAPRVNVQDDLRAFLPVGAGGVRVQEARVGDGVFLISGVSMESEGAASATSGFSVGGFT